MKILSVLSVLFVLLCTGTVFAQYPPGFNPRMHYIGPDGGIYSIPGARAIGQYQFQERNFAQRYGVPTMFPDPIWRNPYNSGGISYGYDYRMGLSRMQSHIIGAHIQRARNTSGQRNTARPSVSSPTTVVNYNIRDSNITIIRDSNVNSGNRSTTENRSTVENSDNRSSTTENSGNRSTVENSDNRSSTTENSGNRSTVENSDNRSTVKNKK
jgi:hypothetical protein